MVGEFTMEFKDYQFCIESEQKTLVEAFKKKQAERAAAGEGGGIALARI
jgi:hypothetical protein